MYISHIFSFRKLLFFKCNICEDYKFTYFLVCLFLFFKLEVNESEEKLRLVLAKFVRHVRARILWNYIASLHEFLQRQSENRVVCGMYKLWLAFQHTIGATNCIAEIYGLVPRIHCVGERINRKALILLHLSNTTDIFPWRQYVSFISLTHIESFYKLFKYWTMSKKYIKYLFK